MSAYPRATPIWAVAFGASFGRGLAALAPFAVAASASERLDVPPDAILHDLRDRLVRLALRPDDVLIEIEPEPITFLALCSSIGGLHLHVAKHSDPPAHSPKGFHRAILDLNASGAKSGSDAWDVFFLYYLCNGVPHQFVPKLDGCELSFGASYYCGHFSHIQSSAVYPPPISDWVYIVVTIYSYGYSY